MKWVEILTLRTIIKKNKQLVNELLHQLFQQKESGSDASIRVYHHPMIDTDLSIHIHWETEALHPSQSPLGQQLSYALKGLGLHSYSIWVETAVLTTENWPN